MFMSESLPAFRRRWKSEIDFRLFCYKEHSQTGKSVPDRRRNERSGQAAERALRTCNGKGSRDGTGSLGCRDGTGSLGCGGWSRNGPFGIEGRPRGADNKKGRLEWRQGIRDGGRCSEQEQNAWNRDRAFGIEAGLLRTDEGKAVRGAVWEMCEAFGAARASRWVSRSGKALALGDLLHRIAATDKQEVRVVLIVGTSCPKAGLPRNRATRCGADRSVSEGYGEEGWSHRG